MTTAPVPHDARKGRHYYTRSERRFARSNDHVHTSEASKNVYSSDDPCGRHARLRSLGIDPDQL